MQFQHTHFKNRSNTHTFQHTHFSYSVNTQISGTVSTHKFQVQFQHTCFRRKKKNNHKKQHAIFIDDSTHTTLFSAYGNKDEDLLIGRYIQHAQKTHPHLNVSTPSDNSIATWGYDLPGKKWPEGLDAHRPPRPEPP